MICIWSGDLTEFWAIVQLRTILENLRSWAMRTLRPRLSTYIDQWVFRFLTRMPDEAKPLSQDEILATCEDIQDVEKIVQAAHQRLDKNQVGRPETSVAHFRLATLLQEVFKTERAHLVEEVRKQFESQSAALVEEIRNEIKRNTKADQSSAISGSKQTVTTNRTNRTSIYDSTAHSARSPAANIFNFGKTLPTFKHVAPQTAETISKRTTITQTNQESHTADESAKADWEHLPKIILRPSEGPILPSSRAGKAAEKGSAASKLKKIF